MYCIASLFTSFYAIYGEFYLVLLLLYRSKNIIKCWCWTKICSFWVCEKCAFYIYNMKLLFVGNIQWWLHSYFHLCCILFHFIHNKYICMHHKRVIISTPSMIHSTVLFTFFLFFLAFAPNLNASSTPILLSINLNVYDNLIFSFLFFLNEFWLVEIPFVELFRKGLTQKWKLLIIFSTQNKNIFFSHSKWHLINSIEKVFELAFFHFKN